MGIKTSYWVWIALNMAFIMLFVKYLTPMMR